MDFSRAAPFYVNKNAEQQFYVYTNVNNKYLLVEKFKILIF